MRPLSLLLLLAAFLAAGCASNNTGKLEGTTWESKGAVVKEKALAPNEVTLQFGKDGQFTYAVGPQRYTGKYSLSRGDYVVLRFDQMVRDRKVHTERIVVSPGGDELTMTDSDGKATLTFTRAEEKDSP